MRVQFGVVGDTSGVWLGTITCARSPAANEERLPLFELIFGVAEVLALEEGLEPKGLVFAAEVNRTRLAFFLFVLLSSMAGC